MLDLKDKLTHIAAPLAAPRKSPFRQVTGLAFALAGVLFALHASKAFLPVHRFESIGAAKVLESSFDKRSTGNAAVTPYCTLALPFTSNNKTNFEVVADGEPIELTPHRDHASLENGEYIIDGGYLCWKQSTPPARRYDLITRPWFSWSKYASIVFLLLATALSTREIAQFSYRAYLSVRAIGEAAGLLWNRIADIWQLTASESTAPNDTSKKPCWPLLLSCGAVVGLVIYMNTGSLVPVNLFYPLSIDPSLPSTVNIDNKFHYAVYQLVDGHGQDVHAPYNMLFRRVLFTWLAYPCMKAIGFVAGGIFCSITLNVVGLVGFSAYVARRWGTKAGNIAALLLCTYPGYAYFCGLPYCYSIIYPATLVSAACMFEIERSTKTFQSLLLGLLIGVACLGYDLVCFFLPATVLMLLLKKRFVQAALAGGSIVFPLALWCLFLYTRVGPDCLVNSNTSPFANTLMAWSQIVRPEVAAHVVANIPVTLGVMVHTFFWSTFLFLPALFVVSLATNAATKTTTITKSELSFMFCCAGIFLFSTLAPDYLSSGFAGQGLSEWQAKGGWTIRLYQPIFAVLILFIARFLSNLQPTAARKLCLSFFAAYLVGTFLTSFGAFLNNPVGLAGKVFYEFFPGGSTARFNWNLSTYGRLPIGFFDPVRAKEIQTKKDAFAMQYFSKLKAAEQGK